MRYALISLFVVSGPGLAANVHGAVPAPERVHYLNTELRLGLGEAPALPFLPFFPPSIALALTRGRQLDRHLAFEGRASIARTGGGDALSSSSSFDGQRFALASGLRFAFDTLFSPVAATHLGYAHHRARWTTVADANCPADLCSSEVERGHSVKDALVGDAELGSKPGGATAIAGDKRPS